MFTYINTHCIKQVDALIYVHSINFLTIHNSGGIMDCKTKVKELRTITGMNRKQFCEYFQIPYQTVTDWERDQRHTPDYVLRLLEYYVRMHDWKKPEGKEDER